jgi:hypothetical protein
METPVKLYSLVLAGLLIGCAPADNSNAQSAAPPPPTPQTRIDGPQLGFPVDCVIGQTCEVQNYIDHDPGPGAKDYRCGSNTYDAHGGLDLRILDLKAQAAGVNVLATAPGRVARLRDGVADVSVRTTGPQAVSGQECGNGVVLDHGGGWETQYCHLAKGSIVVKVGDNVAAGQPLAPNGLSGNNEYPHLHLSVRHDGQNIDPFSPTLAADACDAKGSGQGLWTPAAAKALAYKPGVVLNSGFAGGAVSMAGIESRDVTPASAVSPLVAYVRAINLRAGDIQQLTLFGPNGEQLSTAAEQPLERSKAQYMMFVGRKAPVSGWPAGEYRAEYVVKRAGQVAVSRSFHLRM